MENIGEGGVCMSTDSKRVVTTNLDENVRYLNEKLAVDENFDIVHLELEYAGINMAMYLVDGFAKDDILHHLMKLLAKLNPDQLNPDPLQKLIKTYLPYVEIDTESDLDAVVDHVLAGPTALVVDGASQVILIDARTYPVRSPDEPDVERVVRGARDGFVETIIFNAALIRRRVRDRTLRMEYMKIGRRSQTDICVSYLKDIADPEIVKQIKSSLDKIDTDGLPMAEKTVEEFIAGRHWNPYPLVRYTERPDTATTHLYEGHVIVIVDGSPSVLITPTTFWHHMQHAEEYRQKPFVGAYLRLIRFIAVLASIFLLPLWFLFAEYPDMLPAQLSFIGPNEPGNVPLILQLIIIEVGIDMMRMATIHTPTSLATALGLVAAILIGEVAVEVGLFTNEVILYLAVAAVGTFATPSYEMSLANRIVRIYLLLATAMFGVYGFVIASFLWIIYLTRLKSFHLPYLWPFLPFSARAFRDVLIRSPIPLKRRRPYALHPKDPDR